ncbi:MAG: hypothetical protein LQ340_006801, partial [Diploschistes diacapsis]
MSRKLQDCLALASYKNRNGFDRMSFSHVEAHYHDQLRKRAGGPSSVVSSPSSSTSMSDYPPYSRNNRSSPSSARLFSDDQYFHSSELGPRKRARFENDYLGPTPKASRRRSKKKATKSHDNLVSKSWKAQYSLPQSSPLANRFQPDFRTSHGPNISFASVASTIPASPPFGPVREDDEPGLPPTFHSSPPRTPPTLPRSLRSRNTGVHANEGKEGADLLLYLATSPSPAHPKGNSRAFPPSTPPSHHTPLPSSMMNTPGAGYNVMGGFSTPGQNFNFADFVNVTPSPAQGAFGSRTPGLTKTPLAAKEARRKLNFDNLIPPNGSPTMTRPGRGLGMEL